MEIDIVGTNKEEALKFDAEHIVHWVHPVGKNLGRIFSRGEGVSLIDTDGRELLDGSSQLVCVSLGYKYNDEIAAAAAEQIKKLPYSYCVSKIKALCALLQARGEL
jgi:adenosylmethionine-8-amino-7-oxononanoate aminotransferase